MEDIFQLKFFKKYIITFGIANLPEEIEEVFKLRYEVYIYKNYIDPSNYIDKKEFDSYDLENKCVYFVAKIENDIVACARLIIDKYLPTELYFKFDEPLPIKQIPREQRGEISRLVASYNIEPYKRPPRLIFTLGLIKSILNYSLEHNFLGGYSFIKSSLLKKLLKFKAPIHLIENYIQIYPPSGPLFKYFNDASDPVYPTYYLRDEFKKFIDNVFENRSIFKKLSSDFYELRDNIYIKFLNKLHFI